MLNRPDRRPKREAEEALRSAIEAHCKARQKPADSRTFSELFDYWMARHAKGKCSPTTFQRYGQLADYAKRYIGETLTGELEPMKIEEALNDLKKRGGQKGARFLPIPFAAWALLSMSHSKKPSLGACSTRIR